MSEGRLLKPHELAAQRAWAEEEGRPEIIAIFQHVAILERQLAEAQGKLDAVQEYAERYKNASIFGAEILCILKEENDG